MITDPTVVEYALNHPEQVAAAVSALGAAFHYSRTGQLPIGRLPWRAVRKSLRTLRDQYFEKPRPRGVPALAVDASLDELEAALREHHFEYPPASYDYAGEDLNLRRPAGTVPHPETGATLPVETHVRAFETDVDRLLCICHYEASRYEAPGPHLDGTVYSWTQGRKHLASVLDDANLAYDLLDSERSSGVDVE
jgi:hypothetical protein